MLIKEQQVLTKIRTLFEGENMQTQYSMLGYRIDLYFYDYKLALEIDKNDHDDRDLEYVKKKGKKARKTWL